MIEAASAASLSLLGSSSLSPKAQLVGITIPAPYILPISSIAPSLSLSAVVSARSGGLSFRSGRRDSIPLQGQVSCVRPELSLQKAGFLSEVLLSGISQAEEMVTSIPTALGTVQAKSGHQPDSFIVHPAVLDNCTQVKAFTDSSSMLSRTIYQIHCCLLFRPTYTQ